MMWAWPRIYSLLFEVYFSVGTNNWAIPIGSVWFWILLGFVWKKEIIVFHEKLKEVDFL